MGTCGGRDSARGAQPRAAGSGAGGGDLGKQRDDARPAAAPRRAPTGAPTPPKRAGSDKQSERPPAAPAASDVKVRPLSMDAPMRESVRTEGASPRPEGERHSALKGTEEEHQRLVQRVVQRDMSFRRKLDGSFKAVGRTPEEIADEKTAVKVQRMWRMQRIQRRFRGLVFRLVWRALEAFDERLVPQLEENPESSHCESPRHVQHRRSNSVASGAAARTSSADRSASPESPGDGLQYPHATGIGGLGAPQRRQLAEQLLSMLKRGGEDIPEAFIWGCVEEATEAMKRLPNVQVVTLGESRSGAAPAPHANRCVVVGDLHGHLDDLLHIVDEKWYRMPDPVSNKYVFNGDFVDRGDNSVEVIVLLLTLFLCFPDAVYLNRGNHEARGCSMLYGFFAELISKYESRDLFDSFVELFDSMPLCALIEGEVLVVHGGPPRTGRGSEHVTLQEINGIDRFCDVPCVRPDNVGEFSRDEVILADLLWSDPGPAPAAGKGDQNTWVFNSIRSNGVIYRPTHSAGFCKRNNLQMIIRSHEAVDAGFLRHITHQGRVVTVFSASNYCGLEGNDAAVAVLTLNTGGGVRNPASAVPASPGCTEKAGRTLVSFHTWCMHGDVGRDQTGRGGSHKNTRSVMRRLSQTTTFAQDEVLRLLRELIHMQRHQLATEFSAKDLAGTGFVHASEWAEVLGQILQVPWYSLRRYLVETREGPNDIPWMAGFLRRFQCPLEEQIIRRWAPYLLQWVLARAEHISGTTSGAAGGGADVIFDREAGSRGAELGMSYKSFFHVLKDELNTTLPKEVIFGLFCYLDSWSGTVNGRIARADWLSACRDAKSRGLCVHERQQDDRQDPRVTSDFHMWDWWLLQRFRELFHGMPDTVSAFRLLDHDRDRYVKAGDAKAAIENLNLSISHTPGFRKQARLWASAKDSVDELVELFGSPADREAIIASKVQGSHRQPAVIQTWPLSQSQIERFVAELDHDKDRRVSYRDFMFSFYIRDVEEDAAARKAGGDPLIWHEHNEEIWSNWCSVAGSSQMRGRALRRESVL
eukprot:TRINITY_DN51638_c0_g1_i1.p1 TRINITY_DN51638_c0_g1~~TRINITY_DN51638_c0_g1_i1.p1  ORF type:complete len:1069 (+),score=236.59 TRINITY_DN51638_c0_g1_i1:91-3207(+)